jgi:hypothetical protein
MGTMMTATAEFSNDNPTIDLNQFYSVEFAVDNINFLYQFKIWNSPSSPMFVLIKSGSETLEKIKPGDVLKMKYYSTDANRPTCHLDTEIQKIHWNDHGRFKGHYAVTLGLMGNGPRVSLSTQ